MILVPSVKIPCSFSQTNQYLLSLSLEQLIALWALVYSWTVHPHGKMLSNIPSTMGKCQNGKRHEPSSPSKQLEHDFSCFLVHKGSHWSLLCWICWRQKDIISIFELLVDSQLQNFVLRVFWPPTSPSLCFHHAIAIGTNFHFAQLGQNHICCSIHSWENYIYDGYTVMKLSYWQSTLTMLHSCYFLLVYPCCGNQPSLWPYILNEINLLMQEDVVGWHLIWLCHIWLMIPLCICSCCDSGSTIAVPNIWDQSEYKQNGKKIKIHSIW